MGARYKPERVLPADRHMKLFTMSSNYHQLSNWQRYKSGHADIFLYILWFLKIIIIMAQHNSNWISSLPMWAGFKRQTSCFNSRVSSTKASLHLLVIFCCSFLLNSFLVLNYSLWLPLLSSGNHSPHPYWGHLKWQSRKL